MQLKTVKNNPMNYFKLLLVSKACHATMRKIELLKLNSL